MPATAAPLVNPTPPAKEETPRTAGPDCSCESCKLRHFKGTTLGNAVVHAYGTVPRGGWRLYKGKNDPHDYYLGVELETDAYDNSLPFADRNRNALLFGNDKAADMRRPKTFWTTQHDGSISGVEFVSHPATLKWWHEHRDDLMDMFKMLVHAGYRSHDNDTCGMHVNISRSAFTDKAHLYRFLTLIHERADWSLALSQRSRTSADHWASLAPMSVARSRKQYVDNACMYGNPGRDPRHPGFGAGRYSALNAPTGEPRFEFRLPRGTLRIDRFYKNLEWVVAMIEYTREATLAKSTPNPFMVWVMERRAEYPNLVTFLNERMPVEVRNALTNAQPDREPVDPTPPAPPVSTTSTGVVMSTDEDPVVIIDGVRYLHSSLPRRRTSRNLHNRRCPLYQRRRGAAGGWGQDPAWYRGCPCTQQRGCRLCYPAITQPYEFVSYPRV